MAAKLELGDRLRRIRLAQNLTLKDVERKARVSATHISEIERGTTSPTVGALARIARALGTEAAQLLREGELPRLAVVRRGERHALAIPSWRANLFPLSGAVRDAEISLIDVEIEPGPVEKAWPVSRRGEALVTVVRGVVEVSVGDDTRLLKAGDTMHFDAASPHAVRNIGDGKARLVWVTTPPWAF
ncbi:MAG: XRE family transcriptional regulator [Candidatus Krumholzibacteria bacterium]|nr:XRE family transcriptional regulator [Candidatus Krumholzibacteria bacterium]